MTTYDPAPLLPTGSAEVSPVPTAWAQPIVALTTGTVAGYEALARFSDQSLPVSMIFEQAWSQGHGPALEAAALEAAFALPGRPPSAHLAVNVSPRAMESAIVRAALDRDLSGIMVEITEAHYASTAALKTMATWLRERGARLAIDDVGSGYAGLERLMALRPELIKLDRTLTMQLPVDVVTRVMVESLVRFAARSGSAVCAEGIETERLLEIVAELDISYGQGFLFGEPRPGWAGLSDAAAAAAVEVHRQALSATPKQSIFLDDFILLERLADRFSEAEELEDVHHAVAAVMQLVDADDASIDLVDEDADRVDRVSYHTWEAGPSESLDELPLVRWVLDSRRAAQVLVTDPKADLAIAERLWTSRQGGVLIVPIITRGNSLGVLSFYRQQPTPWTLTQIRFARIGASQLAATLDRLLPGRAATA